VVFGVGALGTLRSAEKIAASRAGRQELLSKENKTPEDLAFLTVFNGTLAAQDRYVEKIAAARAGRRELLSKENKTAEDLAVITVFNETLAAHDRYVEKLSAAPASLRELCPKENKTAEDLEALRVFDKTLAAQDSRYRTLANIRTKMDGAEELERWEVSLLEEDRIYEEQLRAHKLWRAHEFAVKHGHQRPRYDT
jgi:hypothetical protein